MVRTQQRAEDAVTDATLFLASTSAARITGQTLRIS
jgi:3-oxoacyl-[acyl-carrier protein] reductase